jgi:hypothetical protein
MGCRTPLSIKTTRALVSLLRMARRQVVRVLGTFIFAEDGKASSGPATYSVYL